jgi:hypothetical protein
MCGVGLPRLRSLDREPTDEAKTTTFVRVVRVATHELGEATPENHSPSENRCFSIMRAEVLEDPFCSTEKHGSGSTPA